MNTAWCYRQALNVNVNVNVIWTRRVILVWVTPPLENDYSLIFIYPWAVYCDRPTQLYLKGRGRGEGQKNCGGTLFPYNTASLDQRFKHFPANTASLDQRFKHFPANTVLLGEQCDLCCYQTAKARTLCVYSRYNVEVLKNLLSSQLHRAAPHRTAPFFALFTLIGFFFTKYYPP